MASNVNPEEKLQPEQVQALAALLSCRDVKTAAKTAGISERQLHRWLKEDADFQAALKAAEGQMIDEAVRRLVQTSNSALDVLIVVMANKKVAPGVRVRAAGLVLDNLLKLRQFADLEGRIAKLEELNSNAGN